MSTFSIPSRNGHVQGVNYAYQGVEPINGREDDMVRHAYYQWVPFVLFLQGIMFYLPHWLWKTYEGGCLQKITGGLRGRTLDVEQRKSQVEVLVKYVKETMKLNQWYASVFILCDFLNFINVVGQMFFINKFLGGVFMDYGTKVLYFSDMEAEDRTDPLIEVFPRLTKCTFHKYGHSGTIEKHDALCLLALNIISEKIYVFLWFWLIILAVLTAVYMIYTVAVIAVPALRKTMLQRNAKTTYSNDDRLDLLMKKADLGDWFLLFLLSKNLDSILFREFISQLTEKLKTEPEYWDDLIWDADPSQVLLQAEVNSLEDEDYKKDDDRSPDLNVEPSAPKEPEKLYPTAPTLDESSDANSTASVHSTSV